MIRAERTAKAYGEAQAASLRDLANGARARLESAEGLRQDATAASGAFAIYRDAGVLAAAALVRSKNPDAPLDTSDRGSISSAYDSVIEAHPELRAPENLDGTYWREQDARELDELDEGEAILKCARAEEWTQDRLAHVESRTVLEIRRSRAMRIAIAVMLVLGICTKLYLSRRGPNLARGKPVTMSSMWAESGPPESVVNGLIETDYAAATDNQTDPWITVDLQNLYWLHAVEIYGRGTGNVSECLPLIFEISRDGAGWMEVGHRTIGFSRKSPWSVRIDKPVFARYIRVRTAGKGLIAITEIEAFGKPNY